MKEKRVLFVISEDWALISHRLHLVELAIHSGYQVGLATKITKHQNFLEARGIKVFQWRFQRGSLNPLKEIISLISLTKIYWKYQPDLIHAVAQKPLIYAGLAKILYRNIPFIGALGGLGFIFTNGSIKAKLLRPIIKIFLKIALYGNRTRLILQNYDNINTIKNNNIIKNSNIRLVKGAGVEIEKFVPSKIPKHAPIVILPARILWDKGVAEFIQIARQIKIKKLNARFVLVGDIDLDNPASVSKQQIITWVNSGIVEHWSRRSNMNEVYSKASIVCLPSHYEGLPKVLLEGASCSRPLVAFNIPGCRDIIKDGINGFLVDFGDCNSLEKKIIKLINNKELCEKMGKEGRKIVEANFSSSLINSQTFSIWDEVIQK